jgi:hypothetical protein
MIEHDQQIGLIVNAQDARELFAIIQHGSGLQAAVAGNQKQKDERVDLLNEL